MASRTPNGAGLAVSPSELQELQNHRYWGRYATPATLPNVAGGGNTLTGAGFDKLRRGDIAAVDGGDGALDLYVCTTLGTAGGDDTVWTMLSASATIRDAHVYVVGNSQAAPSGTSDSASEVDYLDTGNGAMLDQALTDAAANFAGLQVDVRVRPGSYNLAGGGGPGEIVIAANTTLIGDAQPRASLGALIEGAGRVIDMTAGAGLKEIGVRCNTDGPAAETAIVRMGGSDIRIESVRVVMDVGAPTNTQNALDTGTAAITGAIEIENLEVDASGVNVGDFRGVVFGDASAGHIPPQGPRVHDMRQTGGSVVIAEINLVPTSLGSRYTRISGYDLENGTTAESMIAVAYNTNAGVTTPWPAPRISDVDMHVQAGEAYAGEIIGVTLDLDAATAGMVGLHISNVRATLGTGASITGEGIYIDVTSDASVNGGSISDIQFPPVGTDAIRFRVNSAGTGVGGSITGVRMWGVRGPTGPVGYANAVHFEDGQGAGDTGQISACSIMNSYIPGGSSASVNIDTNIASPLIDNTQVGFNYMVGQGPAALVDTGTGTESAHNILL